MRDGGDYTDGETGEVKRFVGHLFDEVVFNDSVSEFIKLRERLANYFDESQTEDIFDYVPPQKTNQIFTPRNVVVQMVDLFEKENPGCFDDPSHTFADLYMKSGLYITEIIKRLYRSEGMKATFPDDRERLDHILEHQVFGIAPTKIIYEIATHFILASTTRWARDATRTSSSRILHSLPRRARWTPTSSASLGLRWARHRRVADVVDSQRDGRAEAARAAVSVARREDTELCARLVFRVSRNELRRAGITTPAVLYDELKQVFWNADEGVTLGDHLSVGFGVVDRRRQVRAFAERHAGEPKNVLAKAYEREYGFSAGVAAIWLDLFAEPADVSVSEWLGVKSIERPTDVPVSCSEAPGRDNVECKALTLEGFLARELANQICDAGLVRRRFAFEFPGEQPETLDRGIDAAGYYEDHGLLFQEGDAPNGHFTRLLAAHPSFAKGETGFENAVWQHPAFRYVLRQALSDHRVLAYEDDSYISFTRLHDVLGLRMADVESYASTVCIDAREGEPFTIASLRASGATVHPLYGLDMPDDFYEGLLDVAGLFRSCTLAGIKVFVVGGEGRFSATDLIEWVVARHEGIERDDLPRLLASDFGIACPAPLLTTTVHNSDVYYDDIEDAYYSSMEAWKREARNELA